MDIQKHVLSNLRNMLDDRLASRLKPKVESDTEPNDDDDDVGRGSEKEIYPDPNANTEEGIPQEGMPEKVMKSHNDPEFSDSEREELKKLYTHGE